MDTHVRAARRIPIEAVAKIFRAFALEFEGTLTRVASACRASARDIARSALGSSPVSSPRLRTIRIRTADIVVPLGRRPSASRAPAAGRAR
jgi:hypothetical protein